MLLISQGIKIRPQINAKISYSSIFTLNKTTKAPNKSTKMKKIPDANKQTGIFFYGVDLLIVIHKINFCK